MGTNEMEICAQGTVEKQATTISEKRNSNNEAVFDTRKTNAMQVKLPCSYHSQLP